MLVSVLKNWIGAPRFWLTLGTVLIVVAMGLTYHNDQNLADKTLASKVDLPKPVRIQDFDRATDSNLLGELQMLAEIDMGKSVLRQFSEGETQETYLLLPVYGLSAGSRARSDMFILGAAAQPHRPVPRPVQRLGGDRFAVPIAVLVYDMTDTAPRPTDAEALGLRVLGRGFNGDMVVISGVAFSRVLWAEGTSRADVAIAAREIFGFSADHTVPLIAPYRTLRDATGGADMTEARNFLAAAGFVALLFGLSLLVRGHPKRPHSRTPTERSTPTTPPSNASKAYFHPLMPQDEIQDAERDARVSSELSFRRISRRVAPALSRLRSRR